MRWRHRRRQQRVPGRAEAGSFPEAEASESLAKYDRISQKRAAGKEREAMQKAQRKQAHGGEPELPAEAKPMQQPSNPEEESSEPEDESEPEK